MMMVDDELTKVYDDADDGGTLAVALRDCTRQLATLCEELGVDQIQHDDDDDDDDTDAQAQMLTAAERRCHENTQLEEISAVEIAADCMRALEILGDGIR